MDIKRKPEVFVAKRFVPIMKIHITVVEAKISFQRCKFTEHM
jgi:hypothetical protein